MTNKPMAADAAPDTEETYDERFTRQVRQLLVEADDPNTVCVPREEA